MAYDGTIKIGTEIDTGGIEKGLADISAIISKASSLVYSKNFTAAKKYISQLRDIGDISAAEEVAVWEGLAAKYKAYSQNRLAADVELVNARERLSKALLKSEAETFALQKQNIAELKKLGELSLTEEAARWRELTKLYAENTAERIEADYNYLKVKKDISDQISSLEKQYSDTLSKRASEIADFAEFFQKITPKKISAADLIDASASQTETLSLWKENMQILAEKIVEDGFLTELRKLGPKAWQEIALMTELSQEQLDTLAAEWKKRQEIGLETAIIELAPMREQIGTEIAALSLAVNEPLLALAEKMPSIGQAVVNGIIAGLNSRASALEATAAMLANIALGATKTTLGIRSPSKKFAELGKSSAEGLLLGFTSELTSVYSQIQNAISHKQELLLPLYSAQSEYQSKTTALHSGISATAAAATPIKSDSAYKTPVIHVEISPPFDTRGFWEDASAKIKRVEYLKGENL